MTADQMTKGQVFNFAYSEQLTKVSHFQTEWDTLLRTLARSMEQTVTLNE